MQCIPMAWQLLGLHVQDETPGIAWHTAEWLGTVGKDWGVLNVDGCGNRIPAFAENGEFQPAKTSVAKQNMNLEEGKKQWRPSWKSS